MARGGGAVGGRVGRCGAGEGDGAVAVGGAGGKDGGEGVVAVRESDLGGEL